MSFDDSASGSDGDQSDASRSSSGQASISNVEDAVGAKKGVKDVQENFVKKT